MHRQHISLLVFSLLTGLSGCGKSLDAQIATCLSQAAAVMSNTIPINEFQKREIESREQGIIYRCMTEAGFKEKDGFNDYWMGILKGNNPNATSEQHLTELNKIRSYGIRRADPSYTLWQK